MKTFKKTILVFAMTMIMGASAFAASGFESILNLSGGMNFGKMDGNGGSFGFDAGVTAQLGYMFQVKEGFGISLLGELGYSWDFYSKSQMGVGTSSYFHSFQLGLLPKFNIGFGGRHGLAVGIGGGVKIPISGWYSFSVSGSSVSVNGSSSGSADSASYDLTLVRADISSLYSPSVIGYVKASIDYYLFFTDKIAMELGLYLGYDIGMKDGLTEMRTGGFDIGLQLGFRFGPKA